jgi:hypothetical protein
MRMLRAKLNRDEGFTFIEATLAVVLISIMVLGLTIVMLAFKEHLDRSWAIRTMDQYGNDVIENLTHELRNAIDVTVRNGQGNTHRITVEHLDPMIKELVHETLWRADLRRTQVVAGRKLLDPTFPPRDLGRGESFQIVQFTLTPFGTNMQDGQWEHRDAGFRKPEFMDAAWDIHFVLRYNRQAVGGLRDNNWRYEKVYFNRVYMRNMNLLVAEGIGLDDD